MFINDTKFTVLPSFLASAITSFLFLTFVSCHASIFSIFPLFVHCCFRIWCVHCFRHRNNFVFWIVVVQRVDSFPCNRVPSARFLVDSSDSTMHAYYVLRASGVRQVSLYVPLMILQGIAAGIGTSNFLRAFLIVSLNSTSAGSMQSSSVV